MSTARLVGSLILIGCLSLAAMAEEVGVYQLPLEAREALVQMKATVRHGSPDREALVAELTLEQAQILRERGFQVTQLYASTAEEDAAFRQSAGFDEFHSYAQIRADFLSYAAAHPGIAQYENLGYSVQNRELFALRISDNVQIEEDEPELAFWGGIHGNEYAGAEMPYLHALYLCDNYGIDPEVTAYVDDNEIWCIPMINPDGHEMGTRDNANGVDLNRDLGYQWDGWGGSWYAFSQVETRAIREFCLVNNVTLSTSFHCWGDVLFYQWGYSPNDAPDLGVIQRVGERYANAASYAFINSWDDYETHGEVLDYVYGSHGALCYTVEISNLSSQVQYTYERNQAGMNVFCDLAGEGLHGVVTDAQTGEPLRAAVWLGGDPIPAYTDAEVGDLHRLVLPGTYNLTVWANGYLPQAVSGVVVAYGSPGQFQTALQPGGGEYAFHVTSVNQEDPYNDYNNATFPAWALGAPDGKPCSIGSNGFIVLDMGEGHEITDGSGDDFTVTEWDHPRDPGPETYRVYAGDAYNQTTLIGTATGTASFDLGPAGITSTRYLKIVDASGSSPSLPLAGMDLDGITVINSMVDASAGELVQVSLPGGIDLTCHPNPFNPTTTIRFDLPQAGWVRLEVFDVAGRAVGTRLAVPLPLVDGWLGAGSHEVTFDGSRLTSGVYLYRIQAGQWSAAGKMLLLK